MKSGTALAKRLKRHLEKLAINYLCDQPLLNVQKQLHQQNKLINMGKKATKALEKRLKFHEYKAMIDRDLTRALINRKSELFAYSFQIKTGSLKKTHLIRVIKTEIA